jgi:AraC-like DNA-binding protein
LIFTDQYALIFVALDMEKIYFSHNLKKAPYQINARRYESSGKNVKVPYSRNDFFKIWLIENKCKLYFNDQEFDCDKPALFFAHPSATYAYDSLKSMRSGYWCVFTQDFLNAHESVGKVLPSALFGTIGTNVFFPEKEQLQFIRQLFDNLIAEINSSFLFKDEIARHYISLLIYEGLKIKSDAIKLQPNGANARIVDLFFDLLEKQFPIQSPQEPICLKKPGDYSSKLFVHVNHLNSAVKSLTGKPTSSHIADRLLSEAKALLKHSNWSIADIAYGLGFNYANHFNTFFKKHTALTPATFRQRNII